MTIAGTLNHQALDLRELRDHLSYHHKVPITDLPILSDGGATLLSIHAEQPHAKPTASHARKHGYIGIGASA